MNEDLLKNAIDSILRLVTSNDEVKNMPDGETFKFEVCLTKKSDNHYIIFNIGLYTACIEEEKLH